MQSTAAIDVAEEDLLRADLYDFLSALLSRPAGTPLLQRIRALGGDASPLGTAIGGLARAAAQTTARDAERQFNRLFIGLGRGEFLPYASYYMTGFLNEKPLAVLRAEMARLGIVRAASVFEPEDNIAALAEMMAGLIRGRFGPPATLEVQKDFFTRHLGALGAAFLLRPDGGGRRGALCPGGRGRAAVHGHREGSVPAGRLTAARDRRQRETAMKKTDKDVDTGRRGFLKLAAVAAPAVVAGGVAAKAEARWPSRRATACG